VTVAARLDSISVTDKDTGLAVNEIIAAPGQTVNLAASAMLNKEKVLSSARSYQWSVEGEIGTITRDGVFTASSELNQSGRIIVSAAGERVVLPVTVGPEPRIIGSFDNDISILAPRNGELSARRATDQNVVERGTGSAALSYSFTQTLPLPQAIGLKVNMTANPPYVHFLVTGDGSGHELAVAATAANGAVTSILLGKLDFTGVKMLSAELPARTVSLSGLSVIPNKDGPLKGTFYLHQIISSWSAELSEQPPSVTVDWPYEEGDELVFRIKAVDFNGNLPKEVTIRWNGEVLPSPKWDVYTGQADIASLRHRTGCMFYRWTRWMFWDGATVRSERKQRGGTLPPLPPSLTRPINGIPAMWTFWTTGVYWKPKTSSACGITILNTM